MDPELQIPTYLAKSGYASLIRESLKHSIANGDASVKTVAPERHAANPVDNSDSEGEPDLDAATYNHDDDDDDDDEDEDAEDDESLDEDEEEEEDDGDDGRVNMEVDNDNEQSFVVTPNFFTAAADIIRIPRLSGSALLGTRQDDSVVAMAPNTSSKMSVANVEPLPSGLILKDDSMAERTDGFIDLTRADRAMFVQANHAIPFECGLFYFEMTVKSPSNKPIHAALGLATKCSPNSNSFPRSVQSRNSQDATDTFRATSDMSIPSWMYHSHGGRISSLRTKRHYGTTFANDTTIGCGVDFFNGTIFFTQKGNYLGSAFTDLLFNEPIAPAVVIGSDTAVRMNFGSSPFAYDINSHFASEQEDIRKGFKREHPAASDLRLLGDVANYLVSAGYEETLKSLPSNLFFPDPQRDKALQSTPQRLAICDLIRKGRISEAMAILRRDYRGFLDDNGPLTQRLLSQEFIEAALDPDGVFPEAIKLAERLRQLYGPSPYFSQMFSLLGVKDPAQRPDLEYLYSKETLDKLADDVSQGLLRLVGFTNGDSLEKKIKECETLFKDSAAHGGAAAILPLDQLT